MANAAKICGSFETHNSIDPNGSRQVKIKQSNCVKINYMSAYNEYVKHIEKHEFYAKNIQSTDNDKLITNLKNFASIQDTYYKDGTIVAPNTITVGGQDGLYDDVLEILMLQKHQSILTRIYNDNKQKFDDLKRDFDNNLTSGTQINSEQITKLVNLISANFSSHKLFIEAMSDVHDVWACARFNMFVDNDLSLTPFKETGDSKNFGKAIISINGAEMQTRRIFQLIQFENLLVYNYEEAIKDVKPIIAYIQYNITTDENGTFTLEFTKIKADIIDLVTPFGAQGGRIRRGGSACSHAPTQQRVMIGGKQRVIYKGKRGGEYIKKGGEFITLAKALKAISPK